MNPQSQVTCVLDKNGSSTRLVTQQTSPECLLYSWYWVLEMQRRSPVLAQGEPPPSCSWQVTGRVLCSVRGSTALGWGWEGPQKSLEEESSSQMAGAGEGREEAQRQEGRGCPGTYSHRTVVCMCVSVMWSCICPYVCPEREGRMYVCLTGTHNSNKVPFTQHLCYAMPF